MKSFNDGVPLGTKRPRVHVQTHDAQVKHKVCTCVHSRVLVCSTDVRGVHMRVLVCSDVSRACVWWRLPYDNTSSARVQSVCSAHTPCTCVFWRTQPCTKRVQTMYAFCVITLCTHLWSLWEGRSSPYMEQYFTNLDKYGARSIYASPYTCVF